MNITNLRMLMTVINIIMVFISMMICWLLAATDKTSINNIPVGVWMIIGLYSFLNFTAIVKNKK